MLPYVGGLRQTTAAGARATGKGDVGSVMGTYRRLVKHQSFQCGLEDVLKAVSSSCRARTGARGVNCGAYFPDLIRAERHTDPRTGLARRANVLARLDGFRTLAEAGAAFPGGVDLVGVLGHCSAAVRAPAELGCAKACTSHFPGFLERRLGIVAE